MGSLSRGPATQLGCTLGFRQKVVTALDRTGTLEHFFCAQCGAFFGLKVLSLGGGGPRCGGSPC